MIHTDDDSTVECEAIAAEIRAERARDAVGRPLSSVGGWHTHRFKLGRGWLGEAMRLRLERAGIVRAGHCWGNILPPGAQHKAHHHGKKHMVAVWCLVSGGAELHIAAEETIPDRVGQLVVFDGYLLHWVPEVRCERITVAANLELR